MNIIHELLFFFKGSNFLAQVKSSESGQVVIEYILMITVLILLALTTFGIIKSRFSADPTACQAGSINPVCYLQTLTGGSGQFRLFRLIAN